MSGRRLLVMAILWLTLAHTWVPGAPLRPAPAIVPEASPSGAPDAEHHRLTNLPHVYINTFTGLDVSSKETQVWARLWMVDEQDQVSFYDSITIRGRGNSTWGLQKKPYRIKFAKKTRFLGPNHANAKKWTLLANHADKTLMRNALASYIGDLCGQTFTPAAQFVDLTLNGNYLGCYQLSDQVDVRKGRVNISEQDYPLTDGSNISGGYLLEADGFLDFVDGVNGWRTSNKGVPIRIHYPDEEELVPRQLTYIRNYVNAFEGRLLNNRFDAANSYRHYVDSTSLVSWYLTSEIAANPDYVWSMYFYKERDDQHLYFGPVWDCDIAFDNDNRMQGSGHDPQRELMVDIGFTNNGMNQWIARMWQDEWFQQLVFNSYARLYSNGLEQKLLNKVDSLSQLLQQSQQLNYERWNIRQRTLREVVIYSTYDEYVEQLRRYIRIRVPALLEAFALRQSGDVDLDQYIRIEPEFVSVPHYFYTIANAGTGTVCDVNQQNQLVGNGRLAGSQRQQWQIVTLQNGYHQLLNRMTGLALTDPTVGTATATTNLGTQLTVAQPDSADKAQQWHLVRQAAGRYNLNNRKTDHTANLSSGNAANGTGILSYTNDSRNADSRNRLWTISYADSLALDTPIRDIVGDDMDYALAYDPQGQRLHFGADDLSRLSFTAVVYDRAGRPVLSFKASQEASVAQLPRGLYIVSWQWQGRRHSAKFIRQ